MSGSVNKVILIGNLAADPELKHIGSESVVCNFSIATDYHPKNSEPKVEWHQIVAWGNLGENCRKYLSKGDKVYVEGRLKTDRWMKDDEWRYSTSIVAKSVDFL